MPKSGDLVSNLAKPMSNLKERYKRNFLKIRKLMLYDPKSPGLGIWAQNFQQKVGNSYMQNFIRIRKLLLFGTKCPYCVICARNLKSESK